MKRNVDDEPKKAETAPAGALSTPIAEKTDNLVKNTTTKDEPKEEEEEELFNEDDNKMV